MALFSLSRRTWDPYTVLGIDPRDPNAPDFTCVGIASTTRVRCQWRFDSEEFSPSQRATVIKCLETMSETHPSKITLAALKSLAQNTLCRDWHQRQADNKSNEWNVKIERYLREQSERPAVAGPVRQLQYDFHGAKQLQNSTAKDKYASEQEIKLEKVTAELKASQFRWSELTENNKREEDQAATSREFTLAKQQLTELQTNARALEERITRKVENLGKRLDGRNADLEKDIDAKFKEMRGLKDNKAWLDQMTTSNNLEIISLKADIRNTVKTLDEKARTSEEDANRLRQQLQDSNAQSSEDLQLLRQEVKALNQKHTESKDENTAQISRIQEHDKKVERLTEQMEEVGKDLTMRGENIEQLTEQMKEVKQDLTRRDQNIKQLVEQVEEAKQDVMKRDGKIEQLVVQMEEAKQDVTKRDGKIEQLVEQTKKLNQRLTRRDQHFERLAEQMDAMKQDLTKRDRDVVEQMEEANQKMAERDRTIEQLAEQMRHVNQKLAEREDQLSSLQSQNVKRGLFAGMSRQPPRVLVNKISKIMRTDSTSYVQSAA